jgi:methylated-DNA-[protein]-cysteine S-methyltransferase
MIDYIYSDYLGMYVTFDVEGDLVKSLLMTSKKPPGKPHGTKLASDLVVYFRDGKADFSGYRFDLAGMTPFKRSVMDALFRIPAGETMTYGELAEAAGRPGAARAVGHVMATNPIPLIFPCHRVVATDGLGGFTGGLELKRKLLKLEGAL